MVESRLAPRATEPVPVGSVELLGRAIHRVRNLLMSVRGYAELIAISNLGEEEHRRWAARIVEQVDRLETLQSRVDGALRVAPERGLHSLALVVRAAVERSNQRVSGPAREVAVDLRVDEDRVVLADGEDLAEAVAAVIDNAREAASEAAQAPSVRVRLGADEGNWFLYVSDNGPGLAPNELARLGEAFHTRKAGHLGLGLFLSRSLLDRHGLQLDFAAATGGPGTMARIRERQAPSGGDR